MRFPKLTKIATGIALLTASGLAMADPGSLVILALKALGVALTSIQILGIAVGVNLLFAVDARRKARKAAAQQRAAYNASLEDRNVTVLQAMPARRVVYGRCVVGGDIVGIFTSDKSSVNVKNESYVKADGLKHLVIHYASHESQAINEVFIDGVPIGALDGAGFPTSGDFFKADRVGARTVEVATSLTFERIIVSVLSCYKNVQNGDYSESVDVGYTVAGATITVTEPAFVVVTLEGDGAIIRIQKHLGSPTQAADAYLMSVVPSQWTANDRLRGLTYIVATLDLEDQRFAGGPPNITIDLSGKKVFDGRTDTVAYSNNPALCARDFLSSEEGFGISDSLDIDDAAANAAADACDVPITLTTKRTELGLADLVETNQPKYTCNGTFTSDGSPEAILEELAISMAGDISYSAKWTMLAGAWVTPVMDLVDDDLHGQIEVLQCGSGLDDLFNGVRVSYVPAGKSVPADLHPPYQNATFVTDDGQEIWVTEAYPFTDNPTRCANIARIKTEKARQGLIIRYPAKLKAWPLQIGDRVRVSSTEYGWTLKTFRATDWSFSLTSAVILTLQEDIAGSWDLADAAEADPGPNTDLPNPNIVPPIAGLTAVSGYANRLYQTDGTSITRIKVTWDPISSAYVTGGSGHVEINWFDKNGTPQTQRAAGDATSMYLSGFVNSQWVMIEATVINGIGRRSNPVYIAHRVDGSTNTAASGVGAIVYLQPTAPASGMDIGDVWLDSDSGNRMYRWSGSAWVDVSGRGKLFRAVATGGSDTSSPAAAGLYNAETGISISGVARSYIVNVIDKATGVIDSGDTYDIYASAANATAMASALNALGNSKIVVIRSYDEPQPNRMFGTLPDAMYRCGASRAVFGSPKFRTGGAYILIGVPGIGEGGGLEAYNGDIANSTNAWCDVYFQIVDGQLDVSGMSATPRTLEDYSYAGPTMVNTANCSFIGDTVTKISGVDGDWDAGMRSKDAFANGAFATARSSGSSYAVMFGLNSSDTTASYTDIDYAIYLAADGNAGVYREGVSIATVSTHAAGDTFSVEYDGAAVRYKKNGAIIYQHGATNTASLFFDCSIQNLSVKLPGVTFGPMTVAGGRNLLNSRTWVLGSSGSQIGFTQQAASSGGSNQIQLQELPDGSTGAVWSASSGNAPATLGEGGWVDTDAVPIDHTKMYRYLVWVRKVATVGAPGSVYHGPKGSTVHDIAGALNTNPYFSSFNRASLPAGVWTLFVGYVFPSSYAGAQLNKSGAYRSDTGALVAAGTDYRWAPNQTVAGHRAFQYYTDGVGNITEFFDPRIELVDGTEQGVGSMLSDAALAVATAAFNTAAAAQATADGKIDSFWQATAPGSASEGDLWFDTDDNLKQYRWTSGAWALAADTRIGTAIANAATAQATADGKIVTFVQTSAPTATAVGDLWFDSDGGYQLYRWNGSSWVPYQFDTAAIADEAATKTYSVSTDGSISITCDGTSSFDTLQTLPSVVSTGKPLEITASADLLWSVIPTFSNIPLRLYRDSTLIGFSYATYRTGGSNRNTHVISMTETPAAGTYTYTLKVLRGDIGETASAEYRKLRVLEIRR